MPNPTPPSPFLPPSHDHASCLADTMERANKAAEASGLRLTPLREQVLREVASSHRAIGAYEILERIARRSERRLAPISVYRALDALLAMGVVHRLESRNAYFACHVNHALGRRRPIVLACEGCQYVVEVSSSGAVSDIERTARGTGFEPHRVLIEVVGLCATCANTSHKDAPAGAE